MPSPIAGRLSQHFFHPGKRPNSSFTADLTGENRTTTTSNEENPTSQNYDISKDILTESDHEQDAINQSNQLSFVTRIQRNRREKKFRKIMSHLQKKEQNMMIPAIVEKITTHSFFGDEYTPDPRSGHQFVPIGTSDASRYNNASCDKFLLFGGRGESEELKQEMYFNDVHIYHASKKMWHIVEKPKKHQRALIPWPKARAAHTLVSHPHTNAVWLVGGQIGFGEKSNEVWTMDTRRKLGLWKCIMSQQWDPPAETLPPIAHHSCVFYHSEEDTSVQQFLKECEADDAKMRKEKKLLDTLPLEWLVVFGGDGGSTGKEPQSATWIFDLESQSWSKMKTKIVPYQDPTDPSKHFEIPESSIDYHGKASDAPPARAEHSAVLYEGGKMVVFGGMDAKQRQFSDVWILDIWKREWSHMPTHLIRGVRPTARSKHAACIVGRDMYVAGGGVPFSNTIFRLDLRSRQWSEVEMHQYSPQPRVGATLNMLQQFSNNEERYADDVMDLYKPEHELRQSISQDFQDSDSDSDQEERENKSLTSKPARPVNYRRCRLMLFGGANFDSKRGTQTNFNDFFELDMGQLPEVTFTPRPPIEERNKGQYNNGRIWSQAEKERFEEGLRACGENWNIISHDYVKTRNPAQVRNFAATRVDSFFDSQNSRKSKIKFGKWSQEEDDRFMAAVREYGKNFEAIAKVVQSRNVSQVRTRFNQYIHEREGN